MAINLQKFFNKNAIRSDNILYLIREEGKTVIYLTDGRIARTFTPLKTVAEALPNADFLSVNKGIVLAEAQIIRIENGIYFMSDGREFRGRVRTPGQHSRNKARLLHQPGKPHKDRRMIIEQFRILDCLPLPFCVIELTFNNEGHGVDFVFRYCNKAMEEFEGKLLSELIDHSFYEVFPDGERKWLVTYADVALNGKPRVIESYDPDIGFPVKVFCFQPEEGYCACTLIKLDK